MKIVNLLMVGMLAAIASTGCGRSASEDATPAAVALVEIEPVKNATLIESIDSYGMTEFAAANATTLAVQIESQVAKVLVTAGSRVKRGQPLLVLVPSAVATLDLHKATQDAKTAVAELARLQRLRADGLVSESELQAAASAASSATGMRDSLARRAGPGEQTTLRAPRDGVVDLLTAQPGDILSSGVTAVRIGALDALQARLGVDPRDAQRLAVGQHVALSSLGPDAKRVDATVSNVDLRVDPQSRMVAALVPVPAHSALLPGAAVKARIAVAQRAAVIAIPRAALLYEGDTAYVYVAADKKAQRKDVTLGVEDGDQVEVKSGLKAGESLIVAGNAVLQDGMAIRTGKPGDNKAQPGKKDSK